MGNLHGNADEVREYLDVFVKMVGRFLDALKLDRRYTDGRFLNLYAERLIEVEGWLVDHAWLETLPIVKEGPANAG